MKGFTLVELLVTMTIIGILGVVGFANFKGFSQDQLLNKAIGQIQTSLREAQSNASSGVLCNNQSGAEWSLQINSDGKTIQLVCTVTTSTVVKSYVLDGVLIGNNSITTLSCPGGINPPLIVIFNPLSSSVKKIIGAADCFSNSSNTTITLTNQKNQAAKTLTISKGGAINVGQ